MNQAMVVFEQIKPLVSKLTDSERLELIRTIALAPTSSDATKMPEIDDVDSNNLDANELVQRMLEEQNSWYARSVQERQQYQGKYVAIFHGKVIDHDVDRSVLLHRIREKYGKAAIPILSAQQFSIPEYIIHRPQIVR